MPRHKVQWYGPRLKALREEAGLTQAELGQRAGLVGSQINKLELGVNQPTFATALALARGLGVEITAFLPPPEDEPPPKVYKPARTAGTEGRMPRRGKGKK
jgi:transcriptional regulator with XRE-family HTH domain